MPVGHRLGRRDLETFRVQVAPYFLLFAVLPLVMSGYCFASQSFSTGIQTGGVQNGSLIEASGIVASRINPNVLWAHNDSGNAAQIFPMTPSGANLGTYAISGATNFDWEDIAVGPGPVAGSQYLYIGDVGDNLAIRSNISVYRVPEPVVSDTQSPLSTSLSGAAKFTFAYPDGPRDAESLFVDPITKDIYIITKRENPHHLYRAAYPQSTSGTTTLELMTTFTDPNWLTAADISLDGNEIIARATGSTSGRLYVRPPGGSITDAFNAAPITIPLSSEIQGEAIGFDPNGWGYYTTSEGSNPPIHYFNRLPPPAGTVYWDNDGVAAGTYLTTGAGMGGTGTWNTSAVKWYNGSSEVPWVNGNSVVFWGTAGTVSLSAGQTVNSLTFKTSGYLITGSTLTLAGSSITVDSGVTAAISSTVAGSAGLVKNGSGLLNLTHSNTYGGGTSINGGTLRVQNTTGSGVGGGNVAVNAGGTLGGSGLIGTPADTANVTVNPGGRIAPGSSPGTLTVFGNVSFASGSFLDIELGGVTPGSQFDKLAVNGAATLGGTLNVSLVDGFTPSAGNNFDILSATGGLADTTFLSVILPSLPSGVSWQVAYNTNSVVLTAVLDGDYNHNNAVDAADYVLWRKSNNTGPAYDLWRANFGQSASSGDLSNAVPEPRAWFCLGVGVAMLLTIRVRPVMFARVAVREGTA